MKSLKQRSTFTLNFNFLTIYNNARICKLFENKIEKHRSVSDLREKYIAIYLFFFNCYYFYIFMQYFILYYYYMTHKKVKSRRNNNIVTLVHMYIARTDIESLFIYGQDRGRGERLPNVNVCDAMTTTRRTGSRKRWRRR